MQNAKFEKLTRNWQTGGWYMSQKWRKTQLRGACGLYVSELLLSVLQSTLQRHWSFSVLATIVRIVLMCYLNLESSSISPMQTWRSCSPKHQNRSPKILDPIKGLSYIKSKSNFCCSRSWTYFIMVWRTVIILSFFCHFLLRSAGAV